MLRDSSGYATASWFGWRYLSRVLKRGQQLVLHGRVGRYKGAIVIQQPDYEIVENGEDERLHTGRLVPVYSLTEGLPQRALRALMWRLVESYGAEVDEVLPEGVRTRRGLVGLAQAIKDAHFPQTDSALAAARRRLSFDEGLLLQLGLAILRSRVARARGLALNPRGDLVARLRARLPWKLTGAQERVWEEIRRDMAAPHPMPRILPGDADSPHAGPHDLRRSGRVGPRRAAAGSTPDRHRRASRGQAPRDLQVLARAGRRRPPDLRRLPAGRGVRGARPQGGDGHGAPSRGRNFSRSGGWSASRAPGLRREGRDHAALQGRGDPRAGLHDRDRGGHRRAERLGHADRARRALRSLAAAPASRARRPRGVEILLHPADVRASHRGSAAPDRRDDVDQRRLPHRRGRPRAARPRRVLRHAPVGAPRVPGGGSAARHQPARGGAPRGERHRRARSRAVRAGASRTARRAPGALARQARAGDRRLATCVILYNKYMLTPSAEGFSVLIVELLTCLRGGEPRGRAG